MVGAKIRVRVRFSVWLVSGYAHVFVLLAVVIVRLPKNVPLLVKRRRHFTRIYQLLQ